MGFMKHKLAEEEGKRILAESIAVEAGAIKECEFHPGTFINQYDQDALQTAYKIANSRFTKGDDFVSSFETRRELTDMIKDAVEECIDECPSCRKIDEE